MRIDGIRAPLTFYDYLKMRGLIARFVGHLLRALFDPERGGFFLHISLTKLPAQTTR